MKEKKIIYYRDELNDEFSSAVINAKKIDGDYVYDHTSLFKKFTHFFWYRIVAVPIAFLYLKIHFHHKIVNRKVLREAKDTGYFIYGNHTQPVGDAVIPTFVSWPRDAYVIVHPANVSMPFLGKINPSMGAIPLPDTKEASRNFVNIIEKRIQEKKAVFIYPEAHIWPYYTGIRPFPDTSFDYPVRLGVPAFFFTNTYQKRRFSGKPRIVTYIDGPFYPDETLPRRLAQKQLRDRIHETMTRRADSSTVTRIRYIKTTPQTEVQP
jgi:1-acyl-sn-glycerol-3-phosphate acyltransferase